VGPSLSSAFSLLANKPKVDVLVDQPQQVAFGDVLFQLEVVEQRFGAGELSRHDQQASDNQGQVVPGRIAPLYRASPANQSDFLNTTRHFTSDR